MITRGGVSRPQSNAHGRSHANGRCAAHDHGANSISHLLIAGAGDVGFFRGQLCLVNKAYARLCPFQGENHESLILEHFRSYDRSTLV